MFAVPMSLDQVARSRACPCPNNGAFFAPDQSASNCTGYTADNRAFCFTVMVPVRSTVSEPVHGGEHQENDDQQHCDNVLFCDSLYHYHSPLFETHLMKIIAAQSVPARSQHGGLKKAALNSAPTHRSMPA